MGKRTRGRLPMLPSSRPVHTIWCLPHQHRGRPTSCKFPKHSNNHKHKAAVRAFILGASKAARIDIHCPSVQEFIDVGKDVMKGGAIGRGAKRRMLWCLSEAMKEQDREIISAAQAISLFRDERNGRLAVRYRAVNNNLDEFSGTLGQARNFGTGSSKITAATEGIMSRMCTKLCGAPPDQFRATARKLPSLLEHLRMSVLCITVDSAGDEVLSGEMMRTPSLSPTQLALTPNLKFVIRDKTHGSRRVISRPWAADPFIQDVAMNMARGRASISRIIQNSTEIRRVFSGFVKSGTSTVVRSAVSNMRAACHRFESFQQADGLCLCASA